MPVGGGSGAGTQSAADGTYTLSGLASGNYSVQINTGSGSSGNYVTQWFDNKPAPSSADPVTVTAPGTTPSINAAMVAIRSTVTTASVTPTVTKRGASVAYYASVIPTSGSGTPTGTVTFTIRTTTPCTATLSGGRGACFATNAPLGIDTVTATYSGRSLLPLRRARPR